MGKVKQEVKKNLEERIINIQRLVGAPVIVVLAVDNKQSLSFVSIHSKKSFDDFDEDENRLPSQEGLSLSGLSGLGLNAQDYIG